MGEELAQELEVDAPELEPSDENRTNIEAVQAETASGMSRRKNKYHEDGSAAVGQTQEGQLRCPSKRCGSTEVESTSEGVFCTQCGAVIEESSFDMSVGFTDKQDGSRTVNGQFVSNMCTTPYRFAAGGTVGYSRESRDVTIANGKKKIQALAASLNLETCVDAAHRLFLSAVQRNFVHGRKTNNVVAACLYIVCRQRKASHLLIDFADALQTNVYVLGNCFLKFRRLLNLDLPAIDPAHYIDRFASKLEFGEKTHEVSKTAHKLVARMKRDWIQSGRRPSGVCGAALIIAARMHGFSRTQRDVVQVMKICEETLRRRLTEFESTPSSDLTVAEFMQIDLPTECDPPSFTRNRLKTGEQTSRLAVLKNRRYTTSNSPITAVVPAVDSTNSRNGNGGTSTAVVTTESSRNSNGEGSGRRMTRKGRGRRGGGSYDNNGNAGDVNGEFASPNKTRAELIEERREAQEKMYKTLDQELAECLQSFEEQEASSGSQSTQVETVNTNVAAAPNFSVNNSTPVSTSTVLVVANLSAPVSTEEQPANERTASTQPNDSMNDVQYEAATDDVLFKDEINDLILDESESFKKKVIWQAQNKTYLEKEMQDRREGKVKRKRKRKTRAEREAELADSAVESTRNMVQSNKRISRKVNYETWGKIFETV